ncbi:hypothetical protein [Moraxella oblonga]|uniref:hypothetical protein n=1 Tax=Moraxella oblonga TaxID=200413 RepID=UPI00082B7CA0|nr:hypothetical protein [Moraxella oblonga]
MTMPAMPHLIACPHCHHQHEIWLSDSIFINLELDLDKTWDDFYQKQYIHLCPNCQKEFDEHDVILKM